MSNLINQLEEIASRAVTLYSRPSVAMELVRLTEEPRVDAKRLKECVAQDPALTCKILRVVNSSLYGLNRPVADLGQAIGLLGIKRLKLLVLGFNLPDTLFAEVAANELRWYWTNTLTRAVAARLLAEQVWRQAGDEAFIAGLLQDIGILVLLRELGEPYARFLTGVIEEKCHLAALEHDTLGFDHLQLSAALLAKWKLPRRLVEAIAAPKRFAKLARLEAPEGDLPQILHLAELLMQLVGQHRLQVLGPLLEAGRVYRGLTKPALATLVEDLQPQVDQLGQVLSLELTDHRDYKQTLLDAHRLIGPISEQIASDSCAGETDDQAYAQLLTHAQELTGAVQDFLGQSGNEQGVVTRKEKPDGNPSLSNVRAADWPDEMTVGTSSLERQLAIAAAKCREGRQELSLLIVAPRIARSQASNGTREALHKCKRALGVACASIDRENLSLVLVNDHCVAAVISDCERETALVLAKSVIAEYSKISFSGTAPLSEAGILSIGVATAGVVPRNFEPARMIERANRCVSAARSCGGSVVKSIEV